MDGLYLGALLLVHGGRATGWPIPCFLRLLGPQPPCTPSSLQLISNWVVLSSPHSDAYVGDFFNDSTPPYLCLAHPLSLACLLLCHFVPHVINHGGAAAGSALLRRLRVLTCACCFISTFGTKTNVAACALMLHPKLTILYI